MYRVAVFADAAAFLPHITLDQFPADALAVELYIECGVKSGPSTHPTLQLLRLAIPRGIFTESSYGCGSRGTWT
ncbi:hypothetical protein ACFLYC_03660, partial [Chloroflexota bacterium]